jgi:hypothetical protein
MEKLTAHQIWKKVQKENLTKEQYKQLLIDNGNIINPSNKLYFEQKPLA